MLDKVGPHGSRRVGVAADGASELGDDADGALSDGVECGGLIVEATESDVLNDSKNLDSSAASWSELITFTLGLGRGLPWSSQPASTMALNRLMIWAAAVVISRFSLVLRNSTKM